MSDSLLQILEILNEVLAERTTSSKKMIDKSSQEQASFNFAFPKFRISDDWGKPGSEDRKIIESFTQKITGNTFAEKINSLNSLVSECDERCAKSKDSSEILATLVFLDSLSSVIYQFDPKVGGVLFESLVASLMGADAKQISTAGKGSKTEVVDVVLSGGEPVSLKFFYDVGSNYVKGSLRNLISDLEKYQRPIKYIVGIKNTKSEDKDILSMNFYEFTIGSRQLGIPGDYFVEDLAKGEEKKKFRILVSEIVRATPIATLDFGASRTEMKQMAQKYASILGDTMISIYNSLDKFSKSVNDYFLSSPEEKGRAIDARTEAIQLVKHTNELTNKEWS
jgi:hypothetical protein